MTHALRPIIPSLACLAFCFALLTTAQAQTTGASTNETQTAQARINRLLERDDTLLVMKNGATTPISVELALTEEQRQKGLMFRTSLAADHGMLFDFARTEPIYMWMKNTYIPLDMIFIDAVGTITHIVRNTTPLSQSIIGSGGPVRYVLEMATGSADRLDLQIGDRLRHQLFTSDK